VIENITQFLNLNFCIMKKLLFIAIIVFAGIISASAQSYTVEVNWDLSSVQWPNNSPTNGFGVWITIYDVANDDVLATNLESGYLSTTTDTYTFTNLQTLIENHCNDGTLNYEPEYNVYVSVKMGNSSTSVIYNSTKTTMTDIDCAQFSTGVATPTLLFP
jgi:hypothetical protein